MRAPRGGRLRLVWARVAALTSSTQAEQNVYLLVKNHAQFVLKYFFKNNKRAGEVEEWSSRTGQTRTYDLYPIVIYLRDKSTRLCRNCG
jgi:hypothetical protein